ncbi:glycosyltransferase family 2 protein [Pseudoalteromonas luteoviolacea]|uniref:Bactoprenol glucosyl transferase n=1 Tax=Pseudoalteromonas luteoviolacea NCIMB 1942 TaxID=1365253 RepID=A0A166ZBR5_9GAMM|nr:glycosyltransferase family 2 protein [Pseudoalteromonas luteoviolacea]KZN44149.1 bactoprenol glucosyl transferase [Pseudoalteromonas luteoviolacea NCIMB 1942]
MSFSNAPITNISALNERRDIGPTLSIVVPFYNESEVLAEFHQRLSWVLTQINGTTEIIYVDDGSVDGSLEIVKKFSAANCTIKCIELSRNFGKESAMSAGLNHAKGQAVIMIDADLQDPPELIPKMLCKWRAGIDVVNMKRTSRRGESWLKRFSAGCFYKLLNKMTPLNVPENVGDFRLMSSKVVQHINALPERTRYMKGIFAWPGFNHTTVEFERDARYLGQTKWNYLKLIGLAMDGITSFSIRPLRLATILGALIASSAFVYGLVIITKTLAFGEVVSGYPSTMVVQLALGGVQLLSIGLLGEYIGRIFVEVKQRPLYLVAHVHHCNQTQNSTEVPSLREKA